MLAKGWTVQARMALTQIWIQSWQWYDHPAVLRPSVLIELQAIRMSLQDEAEAAARRQASEASTSASAALTAVPIASTDQIVSEQTTDTAAVLPESVTQPLHNANDPDVPMVPGDAGDVPSAESAPAAVGDDEDMDEDEMLRRAMALSKGEDTGEDVVMADDGEGDEEEDEEAAIARAIAMSLQETKEENNKEKK